MKITKFEDLQIWQLSLKITKDVYDLTAKPLFMKDFVLKDQLRRAIVSISSNIVEGFEKNNNNEFIRFLKIAKGSLGEVRSQLYIALAVQYISQDEFDAANLQLLDLANQVGAFIIYLQTKRKNGEFVTR